MKPYPKKWRPTLSMIVIGMLAIVLSLPLAGVMVFRFYDSHLVRETENELIAQGAFVKAMFIAELEKMNFDENQLKVSMPDSEKPEPDNLLRLVEPKLDLATATILPRRKRAQPSSAATRQHFQEIGSQIKSIIFEAQKTTLAGFRVLDPNGTVITGRTETGQSLAHVDEVQKALSGFYASTIRERISDSPNPPIYSISRGTGIRVFVAMPIVYKERVAGVVYLSRTPSHFLRELYDQRWKVGGAALFILAITFAVAFIFVRTIKGPIDALNARTVRISKGDTTALEPLHKHGTREVADLSQGLLSMAEKLQNRADYINNFAAHVSHELKSPLTSIQGASELLRDQGSEMSDAERTKFFDNILSDTNRLTKLLERLRDLAMADNPKQDGVCELADVFSPVSITFTEIDIVFKEWNNATISMPAENAEIIFSNLIENAVRHGANQMLVTIQPRGKTISITLQDNGSGISDANSDKIFDLFFTTRRETGGTGMGLGIVQAMLRSYGGEISLLSSESGAKFELSIPVSV